MMGRTTTLQVRVVDVSSGGVANPASLLGASNADITYDLKKGFCKLEFQSPEELGLPRADAANDPTGPRPKNGRRGNKNGRRGDCADHTIGPQMGMMLAAKKYDHTLTKAMQFVIFP